MDSRSLQARNTAQPDKAPFSDGSGERGLLERCLETLEGLAHEVDACAHLADDTFCKSICTQIREHLAEPQQSIFQHLYDREINFSISSFWDGGFTVKLGDEMNGFKAETCVNSMQEAAAWLSLHALSPRSARHG